MSAPVPSDELVRTRVAFDAWRATRTSKNRIPETLWQAAMSLAGSLPYSVVARELRLSATDLKKRCLAHAARADTAQAPTPHFLELCLPASPVASDPTPPPSQRSSPHRHPAAPTQITVDRPDGARLSITMDGADWAQLHSLCVGFLRG